MTNASEQRIARNLREVLRLLEAALVDRPDARSEANVSLEAPAVVVGRA